MPTVRDFEAFYKTRAIEKLPTSDNPENEAVVSKAITELRMRDGHLLVDFGCGDGYFIDAILRRAPGVRGIGVDLVVHEAWRHRSDRGRFIVSPALPLPIESGTVDAIFCSQVIEHVPHPENVLHEFHRILKVGGRAWIATPNSYSDVLPLFRPLQRRIDQAEGHLRHFSAADFAFYAQRYGFSIVHLRYDLFFALFLYYNFVAYNARLKGVLIGMVAPELQPPAHPSSIVPTRRTGLAKRLAFSVLRFLRLVDYPFRYFPGNQVIECTLIKRVAQPSDS